MFSTNAYSNLGVRGSTGELEIQRIGSSNTSRIDWEYKAAPNCSINYQIYFPKYLFSFHIIDTLTSNTVFNISESNFFLNLPQKFHLFIPFDLSMGRHALRISFCDQNLTDQDIPIKFVIGELLKSHCLYDEAFYNLNFVF